MIALQMLARMLSNDRQILHDLRPAKTEADPDSAEYLSCYLQMGGAVDLRKDG